MSYITRNANLVLLFLVVLSVTFLVGATVFYESNLARINDNYDEKVDLLKATEVELQTKLKQLEQSTKALSLKTEREATFTQKYSSVREQKEELENVRIGLESDVGDLEKDLRQKATEVQSLSGRLAITDAELTSMSNERDEYRGDYLRFKKLYNSAKGQLDACKANT